MFVDERGNWHAIPHSYNTTQPCGLCDCPLVSGGSFYSIDGKNWNVTDVRPYTNVVEFIDGTKHTFATRERPKFVFNDEGIPTHLTNGITW